MFCHRFQHMAIFSAGLILLFSTSCAVGKNLCCTEPTPAAEPTPHTEPATPAELSPVVTLDGVPTHVLGKGLAEVQVLLDKSNGLASAALSLLSGRAGWAVPEHRHPDADEILYIIEGGGELTLSGEKTLLTAGTAVFIPRNAPHSFTCGAEGIKALQVYAPGGPEQRFLSAPVKGAP